MRQFIAVHSNLIQGILNGYDRMLFRGTLRFLAFVEGMTGFMKRRGMLHKDFMAWSGSVTERIKADAIHLAERQGQPPIYLASSAISKEAAALAEARRRGASEGLIGVFSCVEPCLSYGLFRNRQQRTLDVQRLRRKCLHYYFYWLHPALGLCHLRLQTWAPFSVQVCLNGRERLARQLIAARIAHQKRDNCFVWIADVAVAQKLADAQLETRWEDLLDGLRDQAFPARRELFPEPQLRHYWSLQQSEWATDLLFHRAADLERLYPPLVRQAMSVFQSGDILRFLGRVNTGRVFAPGYRVEVTSDRKRRPEGVRVKHRVGDNSLKLYHKEGSVLRVETTINEIRDFKELRPGPEGKPVWRRLRKGVAATRRRAEVCQHANNRYLDALAAARTGERMEPLLARHQPAGAAARTPPSRTSPVGRRCGLAHLLGARRVSAQWLSQPGFAPGSPDQTNPARSGAATEGRRPRQPQARPAARARVGPQSQRHSSLPAHPQGHPTLHGGASS